MSEQIASTSIIVGIYGLPGSGKTTLARFLQNKFANKNVLAQRYKMSDWIKSELLAQNLPTTRENVIAIGKKMKENEGETYWADRILVDLSQKEITVKIVETGWYISELQLIKRRLMDYVLLIFVETPPEIVFQRIENRDPLEKEESERLYVHIALDTFDLNKLSNFADIVIQNAGTLNELEEQSKYALNVILTLLERLKISANISNIPKSFWGVSD
jgi:dephospho-CoA kinase